MMLNREIIMFYLKVGRAIKAATNQGQNGERTRVKMANVEAELKSCVWCAQKHFPQNTVECAFCVN